MHRRIRKHQRRRCPDDVGAFRHQPDKDVKIVAFGFDSARLAALQEGLVDAALIAPPADAQARRAVSTCLPAPTIF